MKLRVVYVFAGIGMILALLSAILYMFNNDWTSAVGVVSTIISIVMGMVSIVYTYVSGKETMTALEEIKKQNSRLVDKINYELSKNNYNEENIEYIRKIILDNDAG